MQAGVSRVIGVIAVVLALVALAGPWWTVGWQTSTRIIAVTGHFDYGLFGFLSSAQSNYSFSLTMTNSSSYAWMPAVGSVFMLAAVLTILGTIAGIGMIVAGAMSDHGPWFRRIGAVLGILAFLLILIAVLYVMTALPGAANHYLGSANFPTYVSGFWGASSVQVSSSPFALNWGAAWAWYLALVAAILFLLGSVTLLLVREAKLSHFEFLDEVGDTPL